MSGRLFEGDCRELLPGVLEGVERPVSERAGIPWRGIEMDRGYCEIARERLRDES